MRTLPCLLVFHLLWVHSSPTGQLLLRQFPLGPRSDTSLIYWFAIFQMTSYSFFFHPFPLLISLLLNSHLSHFHFPVLWNGNNNFQLPSSAVRISCLLTPSPVIINKGDTAAGHERRSSPPAQPSPCWEQEAPWSRSPCLWHLPLHTSPSHPCVLLHTQLKIKGPSEKCQPESWPGGTQISDQLTTAPYLLIPPRKEKKTLPLSGRICCLRPLLTLSPW